MVLSNECYEKQYHNKTSFWNDKFQFINIERYLKISTENTIFNKQHINTRIQQSIISPKEKEVLKNWLYDFKFISALKEMISDKSKQIFETAYIIKATGDYIISKVAVRFDDDKQPIKNYSVCLVIRYKDCKFEVVTIWINDLQDKHETLNKFNYCCKKFEVYCGNCSNKNKKCCRIIT